MTKVSKVSQNFFIGSGRGFGKGHSAISTSGHMVHFNHDHRIAFIARQGARRGLNLTGLDAKALIDVCEQFECSKHLDKAVRDFYNWSRQRVDLGVCDW